MEYGEKLGGQRGVILRKEAREPRTEPRASIFPPSLRGGPEPVIPPPEDARRTQARSVFQNLTPGTDWRDRNSLISDSCISPCAFGQVRTALSFAICKMGPWSLPHRRPGQN